MRMRDYVEGVVSEEVRLEVLTMYIDQLKLTNVRTFVKSELRLVHPDSTFRSPKADPELNGLLLPKPKLPNANLLLGDNGSGKTTVLQAIALASLGPAARESQLPLRKYVRFVRARRNPLRDNPKRPRSRHHCGCMRKTGRPTNGPSRCSDSNHSESWSGWSSTTPATRLPSGSPCLNHKTTRSSARPMERRGE